MNTINFRSVLKIVGLILMISAASFLLCIPVALIYSEPVMPFLLAFITTLIPGGMFYLFIKSPLHQKITAREGYLSVTLGWFMLVISGTLPFL